MGIKLGSGDISKVYLGDTEISKIYLEDTEVYTNNPVFDSGFIINGTFDTSDNVTVEDATWTISGGVASYDDTETRWISPEISETLVSTEDYVLSFDVINTTADARMEIKFFKSGGALDQKTGYITYSGGDQRISIPFTPLDTIAFLQIDASSGGGAFDLDNVSLIQIS